MAYVGRPKAVVRKYLLNNGQPDQDGKWYCGALGCRKCMKHSQFQASKWAEHMVLDCPFTSKEIKAEVAQAHQTDRIKSKYNPTMPGWETKQEPGSMAGCAVAKTERSDGMGSGGHGQDGVHEPAAKKAKSAPDHRVDQCDPGRASAITEAITRFVVGSGLPFAIINSVFFIDMITSLNSGYVKYLPKVDEFRTKLLPDLFYDTVSKLSAMWKCIGNPLLTLGFGGLKAEAGGKLVSVTETSGNKTAFKSCIEPGETRSYSKLIEKELRAGAESRGKSVQDTYAGVVAENMGYNRLAFTEVAKNFPSLFFFDCVSHGFEQICEDIATISEFVSLFEAARAVVVFVKSHRHVHSALKKRIGAKGKALVLFKDTRFLCAHLMVVRVVQNVKHLIDMIDDGEWPNIKRGIDAQAVANFEGILMDLDLFRKLEIMHDVLGPLTMATQHVKKCGIRASWVLPLCSSCLATTQEWARKASVSRYFSVETRAAVVDKFVARWEGSELLQVGLKSEAHTLAYLLDPYTAPEASKAPSGWQEDCRNALGQFYGPEEREIAMTELNNVLLRTGPWGDIMNRKQRLLMVPPERESTFKTSVERTIFTQKKMSSTVSDWQVTGMMEHPLLSPVAVRLALVEVRAADVELLCKAQNVMHSIPRNRIKDKFVQMLLSTHINLRLLEKCTAELEGFFSQMLEGAAEEDAVDIFAWGGAAFVCEADLEYDDESVDLLADFVESDA